MLRIEILPPDQTRDYIRPIVGDRYGMARLSYGASGNYLLWMQHPQSLDPRVVQAIIEELQRTVPLGAIMGADGTYPVLLLDYEIHAAQDPASSTVEGQRHDGWIVLGGTSEEPRDLVGHELTHELLRTLVDPAEEEEFFALIGQLRGSETDPNWGDRPQERLAEYISTALWPDMPLDPRMPALNPAIMAQVREFALTQFLGSDRVEVVIAGQEPDIVLTVGSPVAFVGGQHVDLDAAPVNLPPGRVMVPIRLIAEVLGCRVEWDQETQRVLIYIPPQLAEVIRQLRQAA